MNKFLLLILFSLGFLGIKAESFELTIHNQAVSIQWYVAKSLNGSFSPIAGANGIQYEAEEPGIYYATFTLGRCLNASDYFILVRPGSGVEFPLTLHGDETKGDFQWYNGDAALSGETSSTVEIAMDGDYWANYMNGDCPVTTPVFSIRNILGNPTAIDDAYSAISLLTTLEITGNVITDSNMIGTTNDDTVTEVKSVTILHDAKEGEVTIDNNGNFVYSSDGQFVGTDSFTYILCNVSDLCDTAKVYINILQGMDIGIDGFYVLDMMEELNEGKVSGSVVSDSLKDLLGSTYTVFVIDSPIQGNVVMNMDGSFDYTALNSNFFGLDSFTYVICAGQICDTAVVYIEGRCEGLETNDFLNIPNLLSPNNDGRNDVWEIPSLITAYNRGCYEFNEVIIFNRWEVKVYHKYNYGLDGDWWDGRINTNISLGYFTEPIEVQMVPSGTYYYIIKLDDDWDNAIKGYIHIQY